MNLLSIGTSTPPFAMTLNDRHEVAEKFVAGDEKDRWFTPYIFEKSTVEKRHSVLLDRADGKLTERQSFFVPVAELENPAGPTTGERMVAYERYASGLAIQACRRAIENSSIDPKAITHIVSASCTGFSAPGIDIDLIRQLPLSPSTQRTHLGFMGCHAGLNALRVARALAMSDPRNCVLVSATELCGLHYQSVAQNDQKVANALFADGAGAAVVAGDELSRGRSQDWKIAFTGSCLLPDSYDHMTWKVSDHGFTMTLSEQIPVLIREHARPWLEGWLERQGLSCEEVRSWAIHPGGPQILHAVQRSLSITRAQLDRSYEVLRDYGNMSSATIFFVLEKMLTQGAELPCVALGFGPGLTLEATCFR